MDHLDYRIWGKGLGSQHQVQINPSYSDSWEEHDVAEAGGGALGCYTWPPRSYSCSFCGREFRSAQALGGHMNVHRRDRAKLKQSPSSHPRPQSPSNLRHPSAHLLFPPTASRVSPTAAQKNTSSITENELCRLPCAKEGRRNQMGFYESDLSVSLNLVIRRTRPVEQILDDYEEEKEVPDGSNSKRRKTKSALQLLSDKDVLCSTCIRKEMDLELRLGVQPPI